MNAARETFLKNEEGAEGARAANGRPETLRRKDCGGTGL